MRGFFEWNIAGNKKIRWIVQWDKSFHTLSARQWAGMWLKTVFEVVCFHVWVCFWSILWSIFGSMFDAFDGSMTNLRLTWNGKRVCIFESFLVMCPRSLVSFAFFRSLSLSLGFARVLSLYLVFSCRSKCFVLTFSCFLAFSVLCLFPFAFSSFLSLFSQCC